MMSPYEGERIFEAEMVRLHLCDRNLEAWIEETSEPPPSGFSLSRWLKERLVFLRGEKKVLSSSSTAEKL